MKKAIILLIVLVVLVLIIPIPVSPAKDGGTREYKALTYKIVKWNAYYENQGKMERYTETKVYLFPKNFLPLGELFKLENLINQT